MLVDVAGGVDEGGVEEGGDDEDDVGGDDEGPDGLEVVGSVEGQEGEEDVVDELADEGGEVVSEPEEAASVAGELGGEVPPGVVEPDVGELADGVDQEGGYDESGGVGEDDPEGGHVGVGGVGGVEEPELAGDEEEDGGEDADGDGLVGFAFALAFGEDVGDEEGDGEGEVAEGLGPAEGFYDQEDFYVGDDSGYGGKGVETRSSEELVGDEGGRVDEEDGDYEEEFVHVGVPTVKSVLWRRMSILGSSLYFG